MEIIAAASAAHSPRKWWVALGIVSGIFLVRCSVTVVNIAIPSITTGLHRSEQQSMSTAVDLITQMLMIPALGWLGSQLGNRRVSLQPLVVPLRHNSLRYALDGHSQSSSRVVGAEPCGGRKTLLFGSGVILCERRRGG